ncbi:MAG: right-handed parallel beta-helix repeat-containing protein [Candidatus Thorarchaeota archaeon]
MESIRTFELIFLVLILILTSNHALDASPTPPHVCPTELRSPAGITESIPGDTREVPLSVEAKTYTTHSPINISSDADFLAQKVGEGWAGNGTETDPYIIEGYNITYNGPCISISNVTSYFTIRDSLLISPGDPPPPGGYDNGIALINTSHCQVSSNTFLGSRNAGLFIGWSRCDAVSNVFVESIAGVYFNHSTGSVIYNEFVDIDLHSVWMSGSFNCNVSFNTMKSSDTAIELLGSSTSCTVSHNLIESHLVGIFVWNGSISNLVEYNKIDGAYYGIYAHEAHNSYFVANRIQRSRSSGILLVGCQYGRIERNVILDGSGEGITIVGIDLCFFLYNTIMRNEGAGVYLEYGFDNTLYGNLLHSNQPDAIDDDWEHTNFWDDGIGVGNCWTYPAWDGHYYVDGSAGNVDNFPFLTEALDFNHPIIASVPDTLIPLGNYTTITWLAWSESGTFTLLRNEEPIQSGDWSETGAFHHEFLAASLGSYNFTFIISDNDGNSAADIVIVSVYSPPPPVELIVYFSVGSLIAVVVILEFGKSQRAEVDGRD